MKSPASQMIAGAGRPRVRCAGFSLTEVLVALALGLFLLMGVYQVFVVNQQISRYQEGMARIQENGRFALDTIIRNLHMARYDDPLTGVAPAAPALLGLDSPGGTGRSPLADVINTSFEGGPGLIDCLGNPVAANTVVLNVIAVSAAGELICMAAGSTAPLVEGVDNMQILYGQDTDDDGVPNRYRPAAAVTDWDDVISVRVALLLNSVTPANPQPGQNVCFACTTFAPAADSLVRGEFTTTVGLRNP